MLCAKFHHFLGLAVLLALSAAPPSLHAATPHVEITVPPLELGLDSIRAGDWPERSAPAIDQWLNQYYDDMPADDSENKIGIKITREALGYLMSHGAGIGHELLSANEAVASYSQYQFSRAVSKSLPRLSWVAMADRTRYNSRYSGATRTSADIGMQFAVLGTPELKLQDGQGQLLLRMMPFGGNQEKAQIGFYRGKRLRDPESDTEADAVTELEGALKWGNLQPGGRIRMQSELGSDPELRMLAEVYLKIEIKEKFDDFGEISIVPRCIWDQSWGGSHNYDTQLSSAFGKSYDRLHAIQICTLNIRFRYGAKK
jgi:hypothetical protein